MEVEYIKGLGCPVNINWGKEITAITIKDAKQLQAKLAQVIEQAEKEPELSEFENKLRVICEDAVKESQLFPERTSEDFAKKHSAELLVLARKELEQEWPSIIQAQSFNAGLKQGKVEALKDLPRWKIVGADTGQINLYKSFLRSQNYLEVDGRRIMLSELEKLPGFKED